jgi:hypothetical protein
LVEADRVDRHVGPLGEVLDPESIHEAIVGAITPTVSIGPPTCS